MVAQHTLRPCKFKKNMSGCIYVNKCLAQFKIPVSVLMCTLCSELPINISTIQGICYVQVTNQGYAQNNRTAVCKHKFEVFYFLNVQK